MSSSEQYRARAALSTRFLVLGLVGSVLLAVPTIALPWRASRRAQHATLEIADDGQETTYYLGEVGEELARLRFHALLPGSPEDVAGIDRRLQAALDALPGTLDPAGQERWAALAREVSGLRQVYATAMAETRAGRRARADELLSREAPTAAAVHDALGDLVHDHRGSVLARLRAAHHEASRIGIFVLVLGSAFVAGLIAIWSVMIGTLRRQGRQLAEYTARLESTNQDLDAFAGRVAHDLKNALGPIVMAPSILREAPAAPTAVLKIADRVERSSYRAVAVVDALLAFSRATRGVEADEVGVLRSAVKHVVDEVAPLAAQLGVSLEVEEIPDVQVRCSAGLLHIVLANLCRNAVKYLEGQDERRVRISAKIEGPSCRIEVADTGPGISKEAQEKIFEPFYRVPGTRAPGTGIGLATVRRIVDARGGRVEVESELGRGSRFRVWLPRVPLPGDPAPGPVAA